ncbi:ATP-binding protein [Methermicoccus shengliensis]|uniref:Adenine nucleotide alpha hydrolase family protein n=1 Tax=Methermicoccus shengliensis TaxID=660064 RepID=A0A832RZ36_9EURY|nr:ATP-binding protein [Methermicoccus shengliensis]KUK04211.1 MAG: hypothetical protein XD46_1074 [Euryarchaeota archaeon 55_53]MDI3488006.1 tRNA-5-methyluridine54 2-sulfurtransferase [Methanosarcinales archaeon]MDN5295602.1 tRNA-5-methyluridine54 2-sulfurtransferase [Methanosarcinales archaeon]HIH70394.1 adenine nucleotide alpha hydrolase family protein [Methermicoccus shengliensis]
MSVCKKCGKRAIAHLKHYRTALCENCYPEFYLRLLSRSIKKHHILKRDERILLAASGGKDSSAMADSLKKLGYDFELYYIDLGIGTYSKKSEEIVKNLAKCIDVPLNIERLKDHGFEISKIKRKPCSACGTAKRYLMNRFARLNNFHVVATGHTAEDIVSFYLKNLSGGQKAWVEKLKPRNESFDKKVVVKAKPLFEISERENMLYVLTENIPFNAEKCPFAPNSKWKEIIYDIENKKPGFTKNFVRGLIKEEEKLKINYCMECGEVSSSEICAFCRLKKRYGHC